MSEVIALGRELGLENLAPLKSRLDQLLQRQQTFALDAAELEQVDTAALQMIFCLQRTLAERGQTLAWQQPSRLIEAAAGALGLDISSLSPQQADTDTDEGYGFF